MTADQILQKHEDANEMHFHQVDRNFIIQAMEEYATSSQTEISDEDITKLASEHIVYNDYERHWIIEGMKLYREQLKTK